MLRLWDTNTNEYECMTAETRTVVTMTLVGDDWVPAVRPARASRFSGWVQRFAHRLWGVRPDGLDSV